MQYFYLEMSLCEKDEKVNKTFSEGLIRVNFNHCISCPLLVTIHLNQSKIVYFNSMRTLPDEFNNEGRLGDLA
jgi:hypothetical protein